MQYLYTNITITPYSEAASDILCALLGEIGFDSFELTETGIKAYISKETFLESTLQNILEEFVIPNISFTYSIHNLENKNWNEEWERNGFDPILEREFGIRLNPRMAFGSGSHETTYQITSLLWEEDFRGQRVLDMGTGTGVLGIAMALRGAEEIVAIDIDEFSVKNATENFSLNNINNVEILLGDASAITGTFNTIVANIHKNILIADIPTYIKHLVPNGNLYISGFYTKDIPEMTETASKNKLTVIDITEKNDWTVMKLRLES